MADLLELVVAVAVVTALERDQLFDQRTVASLRNAPPSDWVRLIGGVALTSLALAGGAGMVFERLRSRRRGAWGLGRWIWSFSFGFLVFRLGAVILQLAAYQWRLGYQFSPDLFAVTLRHEVVGAMLTDFPWALAALCVTAMVARAPADPSPDAREWLGRAYASLVIATTIGLKILQAIGD